MGLPQLRVRAARLSEAGCWLIMEASRQFRWLICWLRCVLGLLMGIRFSCPNGHKLNVKISLAGKRALCPACGAKVLIPDAPDSPDASVMQSSSGATPAANAPTQAGTETATPSIVIALDPSASSEKAEALPPAPPPSPLPVPASSEPSTAPPVVAASQPPVVATPVPLPPDVQYQIRRERSRRNQLRFAIALLVLVVILGVALIWVLRRNAALAPPDPCLQERTAGIASSRLIACAATHNPIASSRSNPQ
jgi:hypothetical protein